MLAACIHEAELETNEESWFLLRAVLHVLLASKPHPRALKANAAAATEAGLSRAASLLKAYREISSQELPSSPPIHLTLLLFEVRDPDHCHVMQTALSAFTHFQQPVRYTEACVAKLLAQMVSIQTILRPRERNRCLPKI